MRLGVLTLLMVVTSSFPVLWDMPDVTPISFQDFYSQIHHGQGPLPASVIVIDAPALGATDASVDVTLATDVLDTTVPAVPDTSAFPTTTFATNDHLLSAAVVTEDVVEHFLVDFLEEKSTEYSVAADGATPTDFSFDTTVLSDVASTTFQSDFPDSTAKCYQLVAGAPLSIVTLVLLAAGKFFITPLIGVIV